jgi:hypothetical protein
MSWLWVSALVAFLALNAIASIKLIASQSHSIRQRTLQLVLVWLVPIVGAVVCLAFLVTDTVIEPHSLDRTAFADNADASGAPWDTPPGASLCGCSASESTSGASGDGD